MWEWSEFRNSIGKKLFGKIGVVDRHNHLRLASTYQISSFKLLGNILYLLQGPVWDSHKALFVFKRDIQSYAKRKGCFAVVIEPRIRKDGKKFNHLKQLGFLHTSKSVQPKTTALVDLTKTEEELLNGFSKTTRYNIRLARKKNVDITKYDKPADVPRIKYFYDLLKTTQKRKYFHIQQQRFFEAMWKQFSKEGHIALYEAHFKEKLLHSLLVIRSNVFATSLFSASSREFSNVKATYLARWQSICDAKRNGCSVYDFFGATISNDKEHPFYYTTQFKRGFARKLTSFAGTFEIIINPIQYALWNQLERLSLISFYEDTFLKHFRKKHG
jgi:peptidoglycan pentaglycine glycine transferase (the first glycine)